MASDLMEEERPPASTTGGKVQGATKADDIAAVLADADRWARELKSRVKELSLHGLPRHLETSATGIDMDKLEVWQGPLSNNQLPGGNQKKREPRQITDAIGRVARMLADAQATATANKFLESATPQQLLVPQTRQVQGTAGSAQMNGFASKTNSQGSTTDIPVLSGGDSMILQAPPGVTAESRLTANLPPKEFTYIDRPWPHFVNRWAAIDIELESCFGFDGKFSVIDFGSCSGFFSLQAAAGYPNAFVVGVEGSVGIGNGTVGVEGREHQICETSAIQRHQSWNRHLGFTNAVVAPMVWDYNSICEMSAGGECMCDVMFSLSVIHHVDNISAQQYEQAGLSRIDGSINLIARLLLLAPRHFIELPDRPWMQHVYEHFGTAESILRTAGRASGHQWNMIGPLCVSDWYGQREVWMMEQAAPLRPVSHEKLNKMMSKASAPAPQSSAPGGRAPQGQDGNGAPMDLGSCLLAAPTALLAAELQLRNAVAAARAVLDDAAVFI